MRIFGTIAPTITRLELASPQRLIVHIVDGYWVVTEINDTSTCWNWLDAIGADGAPSALELTFTPTDQPQGA